MQFRSLTFLGTSSGVPTLYRNVSASILQLADGRAWLFDCGEGTQHQVQRCPNVTSGKIDRIFVTHMHGDHSYGLPGLMCSISLLWTSPAQQAGAKKGAAREDEAEGGEGEHGEEETYDPLPFSSASPYLEVVGPKGLGLFLRTAFEISEAGFPFQYRVTELWPHGSTPSPPATLHPCEAAPQYMTADANGVFSGVTVGVDAAVLNHRVFCVGYSLKEATTPGTLDMQMAQKLGVPKGPLLSKLKNGESVTFKVGEEEVTVQPQQVVGPPKAGRQLLLLGDTCESSNCLPIASGADWVTHESTFDDANEALAIPRGHSTSRMAGKFAKSLGAKTLILTHFSARFPPQSKDPGPVEGMVRQAAEEFDGEILLAEDFKVIDMTPKKRPAK